MRRHSLPARQAGISLVVTLMITVLLSLLALYGAGVLVLDTRSAANDSRYREAMAAAESGLEQGFSLLSANRANIPAAGSGWTTCTASSTQCLAIRSGDRTNWQYMTVTSALTQQPSGTAGGSFVLYLLTPTSGDASGLVFNIVSVGQSADTIAGSPTTATVKQGVYFYPMLLGNVETPLAAVSSIPLSGSYTIITNPNAGGDGSNVEVSAWSRNDITPGGSFQSCYALPCTGDNLITPGGKNSDKDMIANDPNFPTDLFQFLFGVPNTSYQQIKNQATVVDNCSALNSSSSGLYWVTDTNCTIGDVGSAANPVLIVGDVGAAGRITINANSNFYGLMFMFSPGSPPTSGELKSNGNAHLHGAVMAYADLKLNGSFILEYDKSVLTALRNNPENRILARIPGSWSDVQE